MCSIMLLQKREQHCYQESTPLLQCITTMYVLYIIPIQLDTQTKKRKHVKKVERDQRAKMYGQIVWQYLLKKSFP